MSSSVFVILMSVAISQVIVTCSAKPAPQKYIHQLPMATDRCRQKCLYKFPGVPTNEPTRKNCVENQDCLMCWDYCEMVPSVLTKSSDGPVQAAEMCSDSVCFEGCRFACTYYRIKIGKSVDTNQVS